MAELAGNKDATRQLGGLEVEEWALAPPNQTKRRTTRRTRRTKKGHASLDLNRATLDQDRELLDLRMVYI